MATHPDPDQLLRRVTRDLDAPMALLASTGLAPRLVAHRGFDRLVDAAQVIDAVPGSTRGSDWCVGNPARSFLRCSVAGEHEGVIVVADRRRRWFDNEELRHLSLIAVQASLVLAGLDVIDIAGVDPQLADVHLEDVRLEPAPIGALA